MTSIATKRVYDPPSPDDGFRVLVDRLWPRGVTKQAAALDLWAKDVAPSPDLRKEFNHRPERFAEFTRHYLSELSKNPAVTAFRDRQTDERPRRMAELMISRYRAQPAPADATAVDSDGDDLQALAQEIITARRAALIRARDDRQLDDEVMREMLEQMDFEQAVMASWTPARVGGR